MLWGEGHKCHFHIITTSDYMKHMSHNMALPDHRRLRNGREQMECLPEITAFATVSSGDKMKAARGSACQCRRRKGCSFDC